MWFRPVRIVCMHTDFASGPQSCQHVPKGGGMTGKTQKEVKDYRLDEQAGYVLRRVTQRHLGIFSAAIADLTPPQFAALARLAQMGPLSQNELGRATSMDAATIKGVIGRLKARSLVQTAKDGGDRRRLVIELTDAGAKLFAHHAPLALAISAETLAPLDRDEQMVFLALLSRLV